MERFLALFTFIPMEEIRSAKLLADAELNMAKAVLAFEATKITHGEEAALSAWRASSGVFNKRLVDPALFPSCNIPRSLPPCNVAGIKSLQKTKEELMRGIPAFELFHEAGVCASKGEARRVLSQGGGYVNDSQISSFDEKIGLNHANENGEILLRKGKKNYFIVTVINA